MSEHERDEAPAFPRDWKYQGHNGLTKREYFAGQMMAAMVADPSIDVEYKIDGGRIAKSAVYFADALIAELAK